jgi:hypothetical protein
MGVSEFFRAAPVHLKSGARDPQRPKTSSGLGGKVLSQFAPADLSALVSWQRFE